MRLFRACLLATDMMIARTAAGARLSRPVAAVLHRDVTRHAFQGHGLHLHTKACTSPFSVLLRQAQLSNARTFSRSTPAAYAEEADTMEEEDAGEPKANIYDASYESDYHNFVALTGTVISPTQTPQGDFSFMLKVQDEYAKDVFETFRVIVEGSMGADAAVKVKEDMFIAVQGKLHLRADEHSASAVKVFAVDIGIIQSADPASLVVGDKPLQPANPQQFHQPPAYNPPAAAAPPAAVPGMPSISADPREQMWINLFQNPSSWYDNRETKRGNQPDFKAKADGSALWIDSKATPAWVFDNLQLLPGGKPYTPPAGGGPSSSRPPAPAAAGLRPDFLPAVPSSEIEAAWMDVFLNYRSYWDNRLNKRNPKSPDFKQKEGDVALWLSSYATPDWVKDNVDQALPQPPPPRDMQ